MSQTIPIKSIITHKKILFNTIFPKSFKFFSWRLRLILIIIKKVDGNAENSYIYDSENYLTRAKITSGNGVTIETYGYDFNGNRISVSTNEITTTTYLVDDLNLATVLAENKDGNITIYTYGTEIISLHRENENRYYLSDGHGNVRALSHDDANITDTYTYDAFGEMTERTGGYLFNT